MTAASSLHIYHRNREKPAAENREESYRMASSKFPSWVFRAYLHTPVIVALISLLAITSTTAEKNKHYHVASLCKRNHFLHLYRKIDGAVLRSQNEHNLDCLMTFQTESILQRFMLRFDQLQLDCNDHLLIYDGAHATGQYKADLSCSNTREKVGTIYTRTNYLTLKYVTDGWGTDTNGFHLVITAFKDKSELICRDFRCTQKDSCISTDLLCDGVNHCGDNSDETTTSLCSDQETRKIMGLNLAVFGAVVTSVAVVLCALTAGIVICCCRRRAIQRRSANSCSGQTNDLANGRVEDKPPPYPGVTDPLRAAVSGEGGHSAAVSATGYMTLPLKSMNSGNQDPPVVDQGQSMFHSNFIIPITAHYSGMVHLLIRLCLVK